MEKCVFYTSVNSFKMMKRVGMEVPESVETRIYPCSKQMMMACKNNM